MTLQIPVNLELSKWIVRTNNIDLNIWLFNLMTREGKDMKKYTVLHF